MYPDYLKNLKYIKINFKAGCSGTFFNLRRGMDSRPAWAKSWTWWDL
jgi:hypothetical protein